MTDTPDPLATVLREHVMSDRRTGAGTTFCEDCEDDWPCNVIRSITILREERDEVVATTKRFIGHLRATGDALAKAENARRAVTKERDELQEKVYGWAGRADSAECQVGSLKYQLNRSEAENARLREALVEMERESDEADRINGELQLEMRAMDPFCPTCRSSRVCMNGMCPDQDQFHPAVRALHEESEKQQRGRFAAIADAVKAENANKRYRGHIVGALRELGIPGDDHPAPVANAVAILNQVLEES